MLTTALRRQAKAAVAQRDGRAEQAERLHLLDHRGRIDVAVLELQHLRADVALQPTADLVEHLALVWAEKEEARSATGEVIEVPPEP